MTIAAIRAWPTARSVPSGRSRALRICAVCAASSPEKQTLAQPVFVESLATSSKITLKSLRVVVVIERFSSVLIVDVEDAVDDNFINGINSERIPFFAFYYLKLNIRVLTI